MGTHQKVLAAILSGRSDANISFSELVSLVKELGFDMRIKGDHHIFVRGIALISSDGGRFQF